MYGITVTFFFKHSKMNVSYEEKSEFDHRKADLLYIAQIQNDDEFFTEWNQFKRRRSETAPVGLPRFMQAELNEIEAPIITRSNRIEEYRRQELVRRANFNRIRAEFAELSDIKDDDDFFTEFEGGSGSPLWDIDSYFFPPNMKTQLLAMKEALQARYDRIWREDNESEEEEAGETNREAQYNPRNRANNLLSDNIVLFEDERKSGVDQIQHTFDTGDHKIGQSSFQFFLLDDVREAWKMGDNTTPFACSNPVDMVTLEPIDEPIADNRVLIYFANRTIECWDAYGVSANVASQLANNKEPTHPTDRQKYTPATIALLGFIHGILRESDEGPGIKRKYMQEVFEKYRNNTSVELTVLKVSEAFDNPTIAFKQMVCERKVWFEDKKTPEGLCSAKPLKDLIDFAQYQKELRLNVFAAKTKGLNMVRREQAQKRTVTGAGLPDPNDQNPTYRRIN